MFDLSQILNPDALYHFRFDRAAWTEHQNVLEFLQNIRG